MSDSDVRQYPEEILLENYRSFQLKKNYGHVNTDELAEIVVRETARLIQKTKKRKATALIK